MRRRNGEKRRVLETRTIIGIEDMVLLQDPRENGVVDNLKFRLNSEQIYTYIGHVLVACNPYKWLKIYDQEIMKKYEYQSRIDVAPHVFATAEAAYRGMVIEESNQCVIISGESGAGKTEASKHIQAYIANVSGNGEGVDNIKRIFLESNPVLEAFGNAKTLRNNNSSRFGKYFNLKFDKFGRPKGGVITNYLLEKSRIVRPGKGERNFHIFYQLIASEHKDSLKLTKPSDYSILSVSECHLIDGVDDSKEFNTTLAAMKCVGMKKAQIQSILSLLASILHIGNLRFTPKEVDGAEGSKIENPDCLVTFCDLLGLDSKEVAKRLTKRELQTMAPGGKIDTYLVPQNTIQAAGRRDAISKALYERLFDLIVNRINVALEQGDDESASFLSIGVLDIYGFEVFKYNSFEQLCINYVNEKLQQIFIELTLRAEQEEYESEGITWKPIPFFDNKIVCDLLDSAKPSGIFRILDDTCKTMHGAKAAMDVDKKFLENVSQVHGSHAHFTNNSFAFTIKHYADSVVYTPGKFSESNKDELNKDLVILLKSADNKLVQFIFPEEVDLNDKKAAPTAGNKIRVQCQALVTTLLECTPHYIRCIKPNETKSQLTVDQSLTTHQVKYLGLCENIKVRRAGFAYRAEYFRFLERFSILSPQTYPEWKGSDRDGCRQILKSISEKMGLSKEEAQLGKSKIFIRQPETYFSIERLREHRLGDFVTKIQRAWRYFMGQRENVKLLREMTSLYAQQQKARRRDSLFRPFNGDYLDYLGSQADKIRESIFRIIDYYDKNENVVFADSRVGHVMSNSDKPSWKEEPRILVLTNAAIYLIEIYNKDRHSQSHPPDKTMPIVSLRRRIILQDLESILLSKCADTCIGLLVKQAAIMKEGDKTNWMDNSKVTKCHLTGTEFGIFNWRHHCRVSGLILVDEACNFYQVIPDKGWYTPQRVSDAFIGLQSTEALEDVLLACEKKTEFISLLKTQWQLKMKGKDMPIRFSNQWDMRASSVSSIPTKIPAKRVIFSETNNKKSGADLAFVAEKSDNDTLKVIAPVGLSYDIVEERVRRKKERQKIKEKKRKAEEAARRERQLQKEEEREQERVQRYHHYYHHLYHYNHHQKD